MAETFNPREHFIKIKGRDYLETKWRLVWLRDEHPDAVIETELVALDQAAGFAVFKTTIRLSDGAVATGHGSETANDWNDFLEKAETKSLGRALAAAGYGTQFCDDYDMTKPNGEERLVDSPLVPKTPPAKPATKPSNRPSNPPQPAASAPSRTATCDDCRNPIVGNANLSSQEQASLTLKRFGKMLCTDCSIKAKRAEAESRANA